MGDDIQGHPASTDAPAAQETRVPGILEAAAPAGSPADPNVPQLATHAEAGAKGGRGNKADANSKSFGSTHASYIVRRLKRDHPKIAAKAGRKIEASLFC